MAGGRSLAVVLLAVASLTFGGCRSQQAVELRRFPYPYRAAMAICSDLDYTDSIEKYLAIQRYLCTSEQTPLGPGLGLEVGNSFWFYNQYYEMDTNKAANYTSAETTDTSFVRGRGISIFRGLSDSLTSYAPILLDLIDAGYIDCLHSYGDFAGDGFNRDLAHQAAGLLRGRGLTVPVFVNHGGREDKDNLGDAPWAQGDDADTRHYHADLTTQCGMRFLWRGQVTHCLGQDGNSSLVNSAKTAYEWLQDLWHRDQDFPHDNELVHPYRLDDGQMVYEFVRYMNPWGRHSTPQESYIADQVGPGEVDKLIDNEGYLIFYTCLGTARQRPFLSPATVDALRYIKKRSDEGELFVSTTARLLSYYVCHKYVHWHTTESGDTLCVVIDSVASEVDVSYVPQPSRLQGLTFYVPDGRPVCLSIGGTALPFVYNEKDDTGRRSISVPWKRLSFPSLPDTLK